MDEPEIIPVIPDPNIAALAGPPRILPTIANARSKKYFPPPAVSSKAPKSTNKNINSAIDYYAANKLRAEFNNDVYIVTIAFKAQISNANGHVDIYLEGGNGTPYDRIRDTITFPKGNNVEHTKLRW